MFIVIIGGSFAAGLISVADFDLYLKDTFLVFVKKVKRTMNAEWKMRFMTIIAVKNKRGLRISKYRTATSLMLLFAVVSFFSCSETSLVGDEFLGQDNFDMTYVDSITVNLYTIKRDSILTSNLSDMWIGSFDNPKIGQIAAESFFVLDPRPNSSSTIVNYNVDDDVYDLDSVTMIFSMGDFQFYDRDTRFEIKLEQLNRELELNEDYELYNNSNFERADETLRLIGATEFRGRPLPNEEVEFRLSDHFARELYSMVVNDDIALSSASQFRREFLGFKFSVSEDGNVPFYSLPLDSVKFRMYYSNYNTIPIQQNEIDFEVGNGNHYTKVTGENNVAGLDQITEASDKITSRNTDNYSLIVGSLGYLTRVEFPYLHSIIDPENEDYIISSAILNIYPVHYNDYDSARLPQRLTARVVNSSNEYYASQQPSSLPYWANGAYFTGGLNRDDSYNETHYTMDITSYIQTMLDWSSTDLNEYSLLIGPTSNGSAISETAADMSAVMLGDMEYRTNLTLYLIQNK